MCCCMHLLILLRCVCFVMSATAAPEVCLLSYIYCSCFSGASAAAGTGSLMCINTQLRTSVHIADGAG